MIAQAKVTSWRCITIFILLVLVSGLLLTVSGKMQNPFSVFPSIANLVTTGNRNGGQNRNAAQPASATAQSTAQASGAQATAGQPGNTAKNANSQAPANGNVNASQGQAQRAGQDDIQWERYGGVLFNLWFIAACVAFVMVVSRLIKIFQRSTRRRGAPVFSRSS